MKTDNNIATNPIIVVSPVSATIDPIWSTSSTINIDVLATNATDNVECLPVIGSCQVSSILSNLNDTNNMTLTSPDVAPINRNNANNNMMMRRQEHGNYVVLREDEGSGGGGGIKPTSKINKTVAAATNNNNNNFEDMLYFVCNLCPFLCTTNAKISEHLENAHKNKTVKIKLPQLKCPACVNIFLHKMSLRSHLIHDHGVGNSDLSRIIQAVVYYANNKLKIGQDRAKKSPGQLVSVKDGTKQQQSVSLDEDRVGCDDEDDDDNHLSVDDDLKKPLYKSVNLPKVDSMSQDNAEKIFNTMLKQQQMRRKSIESTVTTKKKQRCIVPSCKVQLIEPDHMKYHIRCHSDAHFKCLECASTFSLWKQLISHLWRTHRIDMELYACDKCDYKSFSLAKLNNIHRLIHSDVKAFVCTVCQKAFKNSKQLGNHKIAHKRDPLAEKLAKFVCELCFKNFSDRRQLRIHMDVVHRKLKPFQCNYCDYKGSSRGSLKMHMRQHTGEKPFACDTCSYSTSDHNSLRRHKLRHTGQKPYKCAYCTYACIQSSTYKVHLKTKHPGLEKDLMFTCQECQFRSVNKEIYTAHMITMHNQKPQ